MRASVTAPAADFRSKMPASAGIFAICASVVEVVASLMEFAGFGVEFDVA